MYSREVKCSNKSCGKTFTVGRLNKAGRFVKDNCPYCQKEVVVKLPNKQTKDKE